MGIPEGERPTSGVRPRFALPARFVGWLGRTLAIGGVVLGLYGIAAMSYTAWRSQDGIEALATIEAARRDGLSFAAAGVLDLAWVDATGIKRFEYGLKITPQLAYKLRIGRQLARDHVRVRYNPDSTVGPGAVIVVEDIPEKIEALSIMAIFGFLSVSAGAALVMLSLFLGGPSSAREKP